MQTRSTAKKETDDDGDSILWDAESIFDPPQHHFRSHGGAKSCGNEMQASNNPLFTPLESLETAKENADGGVEEEEHDALSFKSSLSKDMGDCFDSSFSDYLGIGGHSLKGSPVSNIQTMGGHDLSLGSILPFSSSPLQGLHHEKEGVGSAAGDDHCIMNEALGMSFDFNETSAVMGMCSQQENSCVGDVINFSREKMTKSGNHCSLSTPPRRGSNLDNSPDIKKKSNASALSFPLELSNEATGSFGSYGTTSHGTPARHLSPGQTIYHVASKSPTKTPEKDGRLYEPPHRFYRSQSHLTPERSLQHPGPNENLADKSPEFSPPRGKSRSEPMRSRDVTARKSGELKNEAGGSPLHRAHYRRNYNLMPVANGNNADLCVTPSPSHSQSHIRQAVSDESHTPTLLHYPPPSTLHPFHPGHNSYHSGASDTPASHGFPKPGDRVPPHLPSSYGSPNWSNSLHLAPLPPFVAPNGAPPPPTWQPNHPGGASVRAMPPPSQGYGYLHYSPYYRQQPSSPARYPESQSSSMTSKDASAEATHWRQKHHLLYHFQAKFGHCEVPPGYGVGTEYEGLFEWVIEQRRQHRRMMNGESTTMTPTRARVLSDIGFVWSNPADDPHPNAPVVNSSQGTDSADRKDSSSWSNWISQLTDYRRKHGNVDVPLKYPPNPSLGTFVNRQRTEYRKMLAGKPSSMVKEKIDELNRLGFTWAVRESHTSWEERFEELKAYKRENGHANVPKIYSKNPSLGYWVNEQRFQYRRLQKNKPSYMTEDKIKALNGLDFKWSLRETNGSWDNWLKELRAYKEQHGDVDVPLKYKPNMALGAFVNRQRTEYRKLQQGLQSSLNEKRIKDLDAMGFKWAIRVSRTPWEKRLDELKKFKAEYGHTNVPSTYPKNQPLAYWVFKQRGQYRVYMKGSSSMDADDKQVCHMTPERIRMLNEIGFEWNPPRRIK